MMKMVTHKRHGTGEPDILLLLHCEVLLNCPIPNNASTLGIARVYNHACLHG